MLKITFTDSSVSFQQDGRMPLVKPKNTIDYSPSDKMIEFISTNNRELPFLKESFERGIYVNDTKLTLNNYTEKLNEALFSVMSSGDGGGGIDPNEDFGDFNLDFNDDFDVKFPK